MQGIAKTVQMILEEEEFPLHDPDHFIQGSTFVDKVLIKRRAFPDVSVDDIIWPGAFQHDRPQK
jgi:hypothetical protein